jgi:8-oxo-dGTP pyrophosphatase MutT (NUDIX family)
MTGINPAKLHLTVAALVERDGQFLAVEEMAGGLEVINQPAGHVEQGEALVDAVIREVKEETGWDFSPAAIIGVYLWTQPQSGEQFLRVNFSGEVSAHDKSQALDDGILRNLWLTRADFVERTPQLRSPMVLRAVDDYLAGIRYPVTMFRHIDLDELANRAEVI